MYKKKRSLYARLPKNRDEVHDVLPQISDALTTSYGDNMLLINDKEQNVIVFSTPKNMKVLAETKTIMMDGTFEYCARHFYQFFTIHAAKNGFVIIFLHRFKFKKIEIG